MNMILRYNELLLESLIKESTLYISDELDSFLDGINSPITRQIKSIANRNIDKLTNNYIDISKDADDEVSFITVAKINQSIKALGDEIYTIIRDYEYISEPSENKYIWNKLGLEDEKDSDGAKLNVLNVPNDGEIVKLIREIRHSNRGWGYYHSITHPGQKYIIPTNNTSKVTTDTYDEKFYKTSRNKIKIGRLVRSIFREADIKFTDRDLEDFVNKYKAAIQFDKNIDSNFELFSGDDIKYWYNENKYMHGNGTLNQSCMRYEYCEDYFDIYSNCSNCQLLILLNDNDPEADREDLRILARALVWKTENGFTFMDRIYSCKDHYVQVFRKYAQDRGWYYKKQDNSDENTPLIKPDGSEFAGTINVKTKGGEYDSYPYVDTIKFYYPFSGILSNHYDRDSDCVDLSDTDGTLDGSDFGCHLCHGDNGSECPDCHGECDVEEDCENCDGTGRVICDSCDGEGEIECMECDGSGKVDDEECGDCAGSGKIECELCDGSKYEDCLKCQGDGVTRETCQTCNGDGTVNCGGPIHDVISNSSR